MKITCFLLLILITGFVSFAQTEEEKPTPLELRIEQEAEEIKENTNLNDPEEVRKMMIKLGKLMQEVDAAEGNVSDEFPLDTMPHEAPVMGLEMAEQLTSEIISDFELEDDLGEISFEYYQQASFLVIDMENPRPGLGLPDLKNFENLQSLFISGTASGAEINLDSLFDHLEGKPVTELYLVRNYAGTQSIPESIGKLVHLKKLGLYGNEISALPHSIQDLESLEELYVDLNPIERLPERINRLKHLKLLGIAKTQIGDSEKSRIQTLLPNCKILTK